MNTELDHECVAVHCTVCCPQRIAYEQGWTDGHTWGVGMGYVRKYGPPLLVSLFLLGMIAAVVVGKVKSDAGS